VNLDATQLLVAAAAGVGGLLVAWAATVPLLRYKEQRAKSRRDHRHRDDAATVVPAVAVLRHARCGACRHDCAATDVAPLVGWRTCRTCGAPAGRWSAGYQLSTAVACAVTVWSFWGAAGLVPVLLLALVVTAVSLVDARLHLIPTRLVQLGLVLGGASVVVASVAVGEPWAIVRAVVGALLVSGFLFVMLVVTRGGIGFGDVRLGLLLGLYLGWLDLRLALYALVVGSLVGVLTGLVGAVLKERSAGRGLLTALTGRSAAFAFGPSLAVGTLLALWCRHWLLG
jgi:prepilin signal peptidase PulO-like enzyme (type II secretory pathway)